MIVIVLCLHVRSEIRLEERHSALHSQAGDEETLFVARRYHPLLEDSVSDTSFSSPALTMNSPVDARARGNVRNTQRDPGAAGTTT